MTAVARLHVSISVRAYKANKTCGFATPRALSFAPLQDSRFTGTIFDTVSLLYPPGDPETPISRRVTLFDRATMRPIHSVWSDPSTGAYSFTNLNPAIPFLIVADDYTGTYKTLVADWEYPA
jgi:hypothetical protein